MLRREDSNCKWNNMETDSLDLFSWCLRQWHLSPTAAIKMPSAFIYLYFLIFTPEARNRGSCPLTLFLFHRALMTKVSLGMVSSVPSQRLLTMQVLSLRCRIPAGSCRSCVQLTQHCSAGLGSGSSRSEMFRVPQQPAPHTSGW